MAKWKRVHQKLDGNDSGKNEIQSQNKEKESETPHRSMFTTFIGRIKQTSNQMNEATFDECLSFVGGFFIVYIDFDPFTRFYFLKPFNDK